MSAVNPLQVMLEPILSFLSPWTAPASQLVTALALLYCLLLVARVHRFPKTDPGCAESRKKALLHLRNGAISSASVILLVFLLRWGVDALSRWVLI